MAKKRVHEIAKDHGVPSKTVLDALQASGHDVSTASSSVDVGVAEQSLRAGTGNGDGNGKAAPPPPATPAPAPKAPEAKAPEAKPTTPAAQPKPAPAKAAPAPAQRPQAAAPARPAAPQRPVPAPAGQRPVRPAPQRPVPAGPRPVRPSVPGPRTGAAQRPSRPAGAPQRPAAGAPSQQRPSGPPPGRSAAPQRPAGPPPGRANRPDGPPPGRQPRPDGPPPGRPVRPGAGAPQRPVRADGSAPPVAPRPAPRSGGPVGSGPRVIQPAAPAAPARPVRPSSPMGERPAPPGARGGQQRPAQGRPAGGPAGRGGQPQRPGGQPQRPGGPAGRGPNDRPQRPGGAPQQGRPARSDGPPQGRPRPDGPPPGRQPRPDGPPPGRPAGPPPGRAAVTASRQPERPRRPQREQPEQPEIRDLRTKRADKPAGPGGPGDAPAKGSGPKIIALPDPATARPKRAADGTTGRPGAPGGPGRRRVVIDQPGGGARRPGPGGPPSRRPRRRRRRRSIEEALAPLNQDFASRVDTIRINSGSTVKEVAEYLGRPVPDVIKQLMTMGEMATLTQTLSDEAIQLLADAFELEIEIVSAADDALVVVEYDDDEDDLETRPPVVTIMGHVDHGKTSLLDKLRESEVAQGEAGGITQHIGAYQVHREDRTITFLDTPGHAAFTAMRARGARATDIAVIVVAADDGVKPQTEEAIDHARAADVPIIVAVNKIDKEGADPVRTRTELATRGLNPADWGGDTEFVDVSAKTGDGLDDLIETIGLVADIEELTANPDADASGVVVESRLDPGRGPVATVLIQRGTLEVGDALVAGGEWAKVRALIDYTGGRTEVAGPGDPIEILGFDGVPSAGDQMTVVANEKVARTQAEERQTRIKSEEIARRSGRKSALQDLFKNNVSRGEVKDLTLVLKADVSGSLEAFQDEIARLPQTEVFVDVVHAGVGGVTESDVMLASASNAVIMAFNVKPTGDAQSVADHERVEIRQYEIIYRALEDLRNAMEGMLDPEQVEETVGTAEVRATFRASKVGLIAGCYVTEGTMRRNGKVRVKRGDEILATTKIDSLKRFNEDVREVATGFECGIVLRDFQGVAEGDVLEVYETRSVDRELS